MEIATLLAAVAALGLPCSNPELRDFPAEQMPWPAAYVRTIEGHNIIALREGTRAETQRLSRILVHELLHCGLYEDRERRGQPRPMADLVGRDPDGRTHDSDEIDVGARLDVRARHGA